MRPTETLEFAMRQRLLIALMCLSLLATVGCGDPPPQQSPVRNPPRSNLPQLNVASSAVDASGFISAEFTCDGASASPPVEWKDAPAATKSFALSLWHTAPDQEKSYWVIYNIPANTTK